MSRMKKYDEALKMFIEENLRVEQIAFNIGTSRRTVYYWIGKNNWHKKKQDYEQSKADFSEQLQDFCRKLMRKLIKEKKPSNAELYTVVNLLKHIPSIKKYEDLVEQGKQSGKPTGLTSDVIAQIEREVLGIER